MNEKNKWVDSARQVRRPYPLIHHGIGGSRDDDHMINFTFTPWRSQSNLSLTPRHIPQKEPRRHFEQIQQDQWDTSQSDYSHTNEDRGTLQPSLKVRIAMGSESPTEKNHYLSSSADSPRKSKIMTHPKPIFQNPGKRRKLNMSQEYQELRNILRDPGALSIISTPREDSLDSQDVSFHNNVDMEAATNNFIAWMDSLNRGEMIRLLGPSVGSVTRMLILGDYNSIDTNYEKLSEDEITKLREAYGNYTNNWD